MMTFPMTLTDPYPSFQYHGIFEDEYLLGLSYYSTLHSNRKPYQID